MRTAKGIDVTTNEIALGRPQRSGRIGIRCAVAYLTLFLTMGASAEGCEAPTGTGVGQVPEARPAPAERACMDAPRADGEHGKVAPDSYTDPNGPNCLEIKTGDGIKVIRVSRSVYNACQTGHRYPHCASEARAQ